MTKAKAKRARRFFTPEFKADAVKLVRTTGKSVPQVAKELDLTETALREWMNRAEAEDAKGAPDAMSAAERAELQELRKRVKRLEMEKEILKKAAAFFAKENV